MEEHISKYKKMEDKRTSLVQFDVEEPDLSKNRQIKNKKDFDIIDMYRNAMANKNVQLLINPFQDENEACQMCYKVYACITCLIILIVLYLLIKYQ